MKKLTIFLLLILTIVSCEKNSESRIDKSQFQNKTFSLYSESEKDTLIIEFQDSTHQIFGNLWEGKIPWRIFNYENANFLVLYNRVIGIKKTYKDKFECTYIGLMDNEFNLEERKQKWNKDLIFGTWVKKENDKAYDYSLNDSIPKPPLPPAPDGYSEKDFKWPAFYEISKDSIKFYESYSINKSGIEINNTSEFILMNLENNELIGKEWEWKIKKINSEFMIVEKRVSELSTIKYISDTLIRKKR
jgi:hypothetical protein